ncbi:MAG: DUF1993 domain-containing protein [Polyangiaceae bacterium]
MYYETFKQFRKSLAQMKTWFDKSDELAKSKSFDPNLVTTFRLAPDQFALTRQLQTACDTAKLGASRLTGKEAPKHDDSEKTVDDLRARIDSTIAYLDSFTAKDFEGAEKRVITQPRWEGKTMTGANYMLEHVMPNFFFHAAHVYAMLRHNGVNVGKRDYLGTLTQDPPKA